MEEEHGIVIVGGGIAGVATAVALNILGLRSLVLEKSVELRATGSALTLFPNGWRALKVLGVAHKLDKLYKPIESGWIINLVKGIKQPLSFITTNQSGAKVGGIRPVHRKVLLEALANELPHDTIRFSSKLISIKTEDISLGFSHPITLCLEDGAVIKTKVLIGCDGVHSVVAQWLGLSEPIRAGRSAARGMAVFPQGHTFKYEFLQFVGELRRLGVIPLNDKEVYWFFGHSTSPLGDQIDKDREMILNEVLENLKDFPQECIEMVRNSELSGLTYAPLLFRKPWDIILGPTHKGCVTVAGDAFHPMTPDMAQGGCSALEDAVVLARSLAEAEGRVEEGIEKYIQNRKWRAVGLISGSYLSGWVQQEGGRPSGHWFSMWWLVKLFRDIIFYKFIFPWTVGAVNYDCGDLV